MKKIITYGTFDLFHHGHYNILKRAKELGDYLIVGVTGENFDIERGKIGVNDSLFQRIENVRKTGFADEIIVEEFQGQKLQDVQKYGVDALVIGSDWRGKFDYLKAYCDVIYLERTKDISSTQIRKEQQCLYFGMIEDELSDKEFVLESKFVSGVHVNRVFHREIKIARQICDKYELAGAFDNLDDFLKGIDAVYIHGNGTRQVQYAHKALSEGKHVLITVPNLISEEEFRELITIAEKQNVIFLPYVQPIYNHALNQLFWIIESGEIGQILRMDCIISQSRSWGQSLAELRSYALYTFFKLFKNKEADFHSLLGKMGNEGSYSFLYAGMQDAAASIEISDEINIPSSLTIYGEKGIISVPNEWWNTGYFEITYPNIQNKKRYCYNHEGSGIRYVIQRMLVMLREKQLKPLHFTYEEFINFNKLYRSVYED